MMAEPTAKQRKAALDAIPAFLRRAQKAKTAPTTETADVAPVGRRFAGKDDDRLPPPTDLPPLPPGLRYSETISEESGFAQKPGVVIRRWTDAGEIKRKVRELAEYEEEQRLKAARDAENKARSAERLRNVQRGPRVPDGHVTLKAALAKIGSTMKRRHAMAAIDASSFIHQSYAVPDNTASLNRLKVILSEYQPPSKTRGAKHEHPPEAVIRYLAKGNPKKEGTGAHGRWDLLIKHSGKTVAAFLAAKGNSTTLANALKSGKAELSTEVKSGKSGGNDPKVSRSDGAKLRDEAPKAAAVGSGERDRKAAPRSARKRVKKKTKRS